MFNVIIEKRALADLAEIYIEIAARIRGIINSLNEEPRPRGSKKLEGKWSFFRIRQGDYRIIYEINNNDKEIRIFLIKHRKEVYRHI